MIQKKIIECMSNLGMTVKDESDVLLKDYIEDSIAFMTFVIEIEQVFEIDIPDKYLSPGSMTYLSDLTNVLEVLMSKE